MSTPHKWASVIHAWADGKVVQLRLDGEWVDCTYYDSGNGFNAEHVKWRIKPEVVRYRVALFKTDSGSFYILTIDTTFNDTGVEQKSAFVRWLGDWQEVEV
jgi:hypothetical protein